MFINVNNGYYRKHFCTKMKKHAKKLSLKKMDNHIFDAIVMKMDFIRNETYVFTIRFYLLYLVYYVNNIICLRYKVSMLLVYCTKHIKICKKKHKYLNTLQFID